MKILVLLLLALILCMGGCSDDTETTKDGGVDVAVVEAGTDAVGDLPTEGVVPDPDAAADTGGGAEAAVPDASTDQGGD